jgi:hypothetical protein
LPGWESGTSVATQPAIILANEQQQNIRVQEGIVVRCGYIRVLLIVLISIVGPLGWISSAQGAALPNASAADDAMEMAHLLSVLEANGHFNALYDLIHPDARAIVPRNAVVGWYFDYFAPRGAAPAVVTGVEFIDWEWGVTGKHYRNTAEVSFIQEFWDGGARTILEDVVRLVQDDEGTWRWFFGRSREFVQEMIDAYVEPYVPDVLLGSAVDDVGQFWLNVFRQAGLAYDAPDVLVYRDYIDSICGVSNGGPGFYCMMNDTIYVDENWYFATIAEIGDFAWVTILAHEWGHHVQDQLAENGLADAFVFRGTTAVELEADCLAGVYAQDAAVRGWLDAGDISEAVTISMLAGGDDHGTGDNRLTAFMAGYLNGLVGCGLAL